MDKGCPDMDKFYPKMFSSVFRQKYHSVDFVCITIYGTIMVKLYTTAIIKGSLYCHAINPGKAVGGIPAAFLFL
jgi:hypothetical protein